MSAARVAGVLIVVALALAIIGFVVRVVRWLVILAAVVLLAAAGVQLLGRWGDRRPGA